MIAQRVFDHGGRLARVKPYLWPRPPKGRSRERTRDIPGPVRARKEPERGHQGSVRPEAIPVRGTFAYHGDVSAPINALTPVGPARHPLVEARRSRGWSQEVLAHLLRQRGLGTTRKTVMRWERGVTPDQAAQAAMGELFEIDPATRARTDWPNWLPVNALHVINAPWNLHGAIEALTETAEHAIMDRRKFVLLMGAELLLPVYNWRVNPGPLVAFQEKGRHVSELLVDEIEKLIVIRRKMDDEHGGSILEMVDSDLRFVINLLNNGRYTAQIGQRLYKAAAELGRLAGWAAAESGRHAAAQQYYLTALRAAAAVGDHALGVNVVGFLGIHAYATNRLHDALQLMEAATAESKSKTPEVVQAMAWARAGRAYAKLGDSTAARHALTASNRLMNRAMSGDAPAWSYWVDESRMAAQTGRALCDLGDHKDGRREITAVIRSWGNAYPRDRAKLHGYLATSHLRTGDVDAACESGRRAVDLLAGQVDSDGARRRLRTFETELAPFKDSSAAAEFMSYARSRLAAA